MAGTSRRRVKTHQIDAERLALLQDACEFDIESPPHAWMRMTVLKHDAFLRDFRLDGRQGDMGLRYEIIHRDTPSGRRALICSAFGHRANPRATHFIYEERGSLKVDDFARGEREWLQGIATWHAATEAQIAAGMDPLQPRAPGVMTEPCLTRLVRHHGWDVDMFLGAIPRHGRFMIGRGWHRSDPMPRMVELGPIQAHAIRTAGRIQVMRIGLAEGLSYEPPNREKARHVGILYAMKLEIPTTLRDALIGKPLSRLVEHPALDGDLSIRAISRSGTGVAVRVGGCHPPRPMSDPDPTH